MSRAFVNVATGLRRVVAGAVLAVALVCGGGARAADVTDLGAPLPAGASKVGSHRYEIRGTMNDAQGFYKRRFKGRPGTVTTTLINQPALKAVHISNARESDDWAGINIYRIGGIVRIYVLERVRTPKS